MLHGQSVTQSLSESTQCCSLTVHSRTSIQELISNYPISHAVPMTDSLINSIAVAMLVLLVVMSDLVTW